MHVGNLWSMQGLVLPAIRFHRHASAMQHNSLIGRNIWKRESGKEEESS